MLVSDNCRFGNGRVAPPQGPAQPGASAVLGLGEGSRRRALQLDTDAEIITIVAPLPLRFPGVPGARLGADKLGQHATPVNKKMRRNAHVTEFRKGWMRVNRQLVEEEPLDVAAAKLARRQGYRMDDDQGHPILIRTGIKIRRGQVAGTTMPALVVNC